MEYNDQHLPVFEIGYHFERGISKQGESVFHYHEYSKPGIENRSKAKPLHCGFGGYISRHNANIN